MATQNASIQMTNQFLQAALQHHQAGRLHQAKMLSQQLLQMEPNHADALHLLGAIARQEGNRESAADFIGRAINAQPTEPAYYNSMGLALRDLGKLDEAVASYRKALSLKTDYAETYYNLANVLQLQGKLDEAVANYQQALSFRPDDAEAYNNMGKALQAQGRLEKAITCYRSALTLKPDFARAQANLGLTYQTSGDLDAAVECFKKALILRPDFAEVYNNLGLALWTQGKLDEAIASFQRALTVNPDYAEALNNLGCTCLDQCWLDKAIACYRKAILLNPDFFLAHNNLGMALQAQGKLDEALASFRKALEVKPDYAQAYSNLLLHHAYYGTLEPDAYLPLASGWELACVPKLGREAARNRTFLRSPLAGRRLKIGYVSGDFRQHAVSYFIEQLFAHHDRSRMELFAYSTSSARDAVTSRIQAMTEHWIAVAGWSDAALRERIEADGIDVLIDLSGHTAHNRMAVFARRAAPVQVHYLGYFASTGLSEMDYFIGDDALTPPESDRHFTEQVWRLPRIRASYDGKSDAPDPEWRPDPAGTIRVGSFSNLGKLTPQTFALWSKVLQALPQGKLLLKTKELTDASNHQRILVAMATHGISPERIELQSSEITPGWREHMAYYNRLDIALDPVGAHGGYTTTCDALWMGVPVITLEGKRMATRMTSSILPAIGHPECVAHSEKDYVDKVVELASDIERRKMLRSVQREQMAGSPLCDAEDLASKLEGAYLEMFERWEAAQSRHVAAV